MYDFVDPLTVNFVLVCDPTLAMNKTKEVMYMKKISRSDRTLLHIPSHQGKLRINEY